MRVQLSSVEEVLSMSTADCKFPQMLPAVLQLSLLLVMFESTVIVCAHSVEVEP